jgi:hypothetical protein
MLARVLGLIGYPAAVRASAADRRVSKVSGSIVSAPQSREPHHEWSKNRRQKLHIAANLFPAILFGDFTERLSL